MGKLIRGYWLVNNDTNSPDNVWDAFIHILEAVTNSLFLGSIEMLQSLLRKLKLKLKCLSPNMFLHLTPLL